MDSLHQVIRLLALTLALSNEQSIILSTENRTEVMKHRTI